MRSPLAQAIEIASAFSSPQRKTSIWARTRGRRVSGASAKVQSMLELLRVRAFAIIDELEAHFAPGFNVLTGETGAGKSILVDALHLVLGGRAQAEAVRTGADEAEVQALFRPREPAATDARPSELGLPPAGPGRVGRRP